LRIEWRIEALDDLKKIDVSDQRRIKKVIDELLRLDDPRQKLIPYSGNMKGYWKSRVGAYRLVCEIMSTDGGFVLVISVAHRSVAYDQRRLKRLEDRKN